MKKVKREDLLSFVRDGIDLTLKQQILLVARLSTPAILAQITYIIMQYIDASMVGRLGAGGAASVGLVSTTTWLFGSLNSAMIIGFSVQVAQYIGGKKNTQAKEVLRQSFMVVFGISIILTIVGLGISSELPNWLGGDLSIQLGAYRYFYIFALTIPITGMNTLAGSMLQSSGNMKIPSLLNATMCFMDVLFNWILIFPDHEIHLFGNKIVIPGFELGVTGAALGTSIAQLITSLLMMYFLLFRTPVLKIRRDMRFKFQEEYVKKALKIALPVGFEQFIMTGAMIVTTRIVAPLGITALAAHSFAITAESLCYMPGYGIGNAAAILIGQSIGAKRKSLTRGFARITIYLGVVVMTVTGIVMYFAAPTMMGLLTPIKEVQSLGVRVLRIEAFAEPMYAASIVASGAFRGAGDTLIPSIMNFFSMWAVRIPLIYILAVRIGLKGVWIAMCIELCFRGMIFLVRLYKENWMGKLA